MEFVHPRLRVVCLGLVEEFGKVDLKREFVAVVDLVKELQGVPNVRVDIQYAP